MSKLYVVGIGPGNYENMTVRADEALKNADAIIGYHVYVDLVRGRYPEKEYLTTPMTREAERCQMALDEAKKGKTCALVCSGDSGVYGMAGLCFELRGEQTEPDIEVVPGLTAACSGAALLGAPLTHDFAVISLSDRLTEWGLIEKRLTLAAEADLSIALYNPASHGRPEHLKKACEILMKTLPGDRICGVARNIGREGEERFVMSLSELASFPADMFCTVFIGNSHTEMINGNMVTPRGYRNV
ncbi:MAG: precorrin-3B C(17)-methyltransferase [Clostridiales bacterium]|nr:precorrin-3B C(17)-methyltransferase [Clostridiales bacterium]